jgi:hypothetical protein
MSETTTPESRSQVEWLAQDLRAFRTLVEENGARFASISDDSEPLKQNYHAVATEFFWRTYYLAAGARMMLAATLRTPMVVLQRALYESTVSAMHLAQHAEPEREALIYRACSYFREMVVLAPPQERVDVLNAALARMPDDVVEVAKKRHGGWGWTGMNWKQLGESVGFREYAVYSYLSEYSHSRIGNHVQIVRDAEGNRQLQFGDAYSAEENEHAANFTRRMLFLSFDAVRKAFEWEVVNISTQDPMKWYEEQEAAESE